MPAYAFAPSVLGDLKSISPGVSGEIQLTDGLRALAKEQGLYAYIHEGKTHDAGDKLGFLIATVEIALENPNFGKEFREYLKTLKL
jgi:UTP--glucose-1-phosphate uridylyltransferase